MIDDLAAGSVNAFKNRHLIGQSKTWRNRWDSLYKWDNYCWGGWDRWDSLYSLL